MFLGVEDRFILDLDIMVFLEYVIYFSFRFGRLNNVLFGSDKGVWCGLGILGEWM